MGNIFSRIPARKGEVFQKLLSGKRFKLERIVSLGQVTPPGTWYDQERAEWVVLLSGAARIRFYGEKRFHDLRPGDFISIPAHRRHRVEWTHPRKKTTWLALHYSR